MHVEIKKKMMMYISRKIKIPIPAERGDSFIDDESLNGMLSDHGTSRLEMR